MGDGDQHPRPPTPNSQLPSPMSSWLECSTLAEAEQVRVEADKPISIKTYVPCDERAEERRRQLEEAVWHLGQIRRVEPLEVREIHESDWAEAWKEHFYVH